MGQPRTPNKSSPAQKLALINATETAVFEIVEGLIALNSMSAANDFAHLPMQLLAQGFERLLKVAWALCRLAATGALPSVKEAKDEMGHDVVRLTDGVVELCKESGHADSSPAARDDVRFMEQDDQLRKLLELMANFGSAGRYYDIDAFLEQERPAERDPREAWNDLESTILRQHPEWEARLGTAEFGAFFQEALNPELTEALQRFARSIARLFTLGPASGAGKHLTGVFGSFLFLRDEDLDQVPRRWFESR